MGTVDGIESIAASFYESHFSTDKETDHTQDNTNV